MIQFDEDYLQTKRAKKSKFFNGIKNANISHKKHLSSISLSSHIKNQKKSLSKVERYYLDSRQFLLTPLANPKSINNYDLRPILNILENTEVQNTSHLSPNNLSGLSNPFSNRISLNKYKLGDQRMTVKCLSPTLREKYDGKTNNMNINNVSGTKMSKKQPFDKNKLSMIPDNEEQAERKSPFDKMVLVNNILLPIMNKNGLTANASRQKGKLITPKAPLESQSSLAFKNPKSFQQSILTRKANRNFCDFSLDLEKEKISKRGLKKLVSRIKADDKQESENLPNQNSSNAQFESRNNLSRATDNLQKNANQAKKKHPIKNRDSKSRPSKIRLANEGYFDFSTPNLETRATLVRLIERPKSKWMEMVDRLLNSPHLGDVEDIGYYIVKTKSEGESQNSGLAFLENCVQKIKFDILSATKFAFLFRHY
jgi:hypothetical protein